MAKLDELLEILTEEMEGFKASIKQMEALSTKLNNSEMQRGISTISYNLKEQGKTQKHQFSIQGEHINELSKRVGQAKQIPKWIIVICSTTLLVSLLISGYAIYEVRDSWDKQVIAFNKGKEQINSDLQLFFESNDEVYEEFLKWKETEKSQSKK